MRVLALARPDFRLPLAVAGSATLAVLAMSFASGPPAEAADADTPVDLRTAAQFAVLAGAGITNTGDTDIEGDIGSFPITTQTIPGVTLDGKNRAGGGVTQQAKADLVVAYQEARDALPATDVGTELGGLTLEGGVYKADTSLGLTGTVTLDGGRTDGEPSDKVFIFKAGSTLITETDSEVVLTGGAQACNVFWQVGTAATFKTRTSFQGTVMAYTEAISAQQGATFVGRLLARDSAVTLINNTISQPECEAPADEDADDDGTTGGTDADADGATTGGDADDTDADGGTADDADADGTSPVQSDADAGTPGDTDTDGAAGTDVDAGTDFADTAGDADGITTDRSDLPDTGGPSPWLAPAAIVSVLLGAGLLRRRRYEPSHASR